MGRASSRHMAGSAARVNADSAAASRRADWRWACKSSHASRIPQGYPPAGWGRGPQVPSAQAPQAPASQAPYDQRIRGRRRLLPQTHCSRYHPAYPGYQNGAQAPQSGYAPYARGAYQQSPVPPQPMSAQPGYTPPSAFPPVEQAGMYAAPPQQPGMGARGLVDQAALPPWLVGAAPQGQPQGQSLGMQARSLVDEQALPEWLRQQPEERPRPTVAGWLGASAAEEPLPAWVTPAFPDAAPGRGQQAAARSSPCAAQRVCSPSSRIERNEPLADASASATAWLLRLCLKTSRCQIGCKRRRARGDR